MLLALEAAKMQSGRNTVTLAFIDTSQQCRDLHTKKRMVWRIWLVLGWRLNGFGSFCEHVES
jgi:hypothetical protein